MVAPEPEPAPAEAVVEPLPARLAPKTRLEDDGRRAVLAQVVVRPREESVGLVVRLVERHGLEQSVAGCLVIAGLVENATLAEECLGLHAAPEAAQRALG